MKTIAYNIGLIVALMLPTLVFANDKPNSTAKKEYSESFSISQGATLDLGTSFAEITIVNWDKNEISMSGFVEVEARSNERAQKLVDATTVKMTQNGSTVSLQIELGSNISHGKHDNASPHIEFTVHAPEWINLNAHVSFGKLEIPTVDGAAHIEVEYSELDADRISSGSSDVHLSFGSGNIDHFGGGDLDVSFSEMNVDHLDGNVEIDTSYGETTIHQMDRNVMEIEIDNSFGECNITVSSGETYVVESESSFGDVDFHGNWEIIRSDEDFNSKEVKGKLGNGSAGSRRISVDNSFGSVNLYSK